MMYAMYFKQPCMPRVKIRLMLDEFRDMWALMEEAKRDRHYDLLYAWAKVRYRKQPDRFMLFFQESTREVSFFCFSYLRRMLFTTQYVGG